MDLELVAILETLIEDGSDSHDSIAAHILSHLSEASSNAGQTTDEWAALCQDVAYVAEVEHAAAGGHG